jgi:cysteinyl-tRNA synthetase
MSRSVDELKPITKGKVGIYTCGPTVYDYLQIGNWAAFIRWDVLARTLKADGLEVNWVMNITDVGHLVSDADEGEDKLEKGAKREGKTAWEVADFYTEDFLKGLNALNISVPRDNLPKATDHIPEQIDIVKKLEAKGLTYIIDDGVYFDTIKLPDYGKLARLKIDDLKAGARVEYNKQKRNPTDFALWKFTPSGQKRDMEWESPWGNGFPGWHLECSAMAMKYIGETLDIHAGGIDHIPVHHTNEIAQSEGATGKTFTNIWVHSNFLTVNGTKLSKSLGNSYTLDNITDKRFDPLDFRMFILQGHYRSEANFTWDGLESAKNRRRHWQNIASLRHQLSENLQNDTASLVGMFKNTKQEILNALENDLNTPEALAAVDNFFTELDTNPPAKDHEKELIDFLVFIDDVFGLKLIETTPDIDSNAKNLIQKREDARSNKDWQASDNLRDELKQQGIELKDTPAGPVWSRS